MWINNLAGTGNANFGRETVVNRAAARVSFAAGYIWQEILDVRRDGLKGYLDHNAWNYVEFARNLMYVVVIALRAYAYITENAQIANDPSSAYIPREKWDTFDPQILADALFAASNILRYGGTPRILFFFFSILKKKIRAMSL